MTFRQSTKGKRKGYTLLEITLVMILLAVLVVNAIVSSTTYLEAAQSRSIWTDLNTIFIDNIRFSIVDTHKLPSVHKVEEFLEENHYKTEKSSTDDAMLYIVSAKLGRKEYSIEVADDLIIVKGLYSSKSIVARYRVNETRTDVIVEYTENGEKVE